MGFKIMHRLHILLFMLGMYLLTACSGNLSATVFLDKNGDNQLGDSEPILAKLPATLFRDGSQVDKLMTDPDGNVQFFINQKGKYCVRIQETELSQLNPEGSTVGGSPKLLSSEPADTPDPTPEATSTPEPSPSPAAQDQTASQPITSVKAYEACAETKGPSNISMQVPVPLDFSKTIGSISEPAVKSVAPGDEVELMIRFPKYCDLKILTLPEEVGLPEASGELTHEVHWRDVVARSDKPIEDTPPLAINRDTLRQFPMTVKVAEDLGDLAAGRHIEITPQVSCPNGLTLNLKTHVLEIGKQSMFEVYHDREGETVAGGEVTIITHVINHTNRSFPAGDVRLKFSGPQYGDPTFDPSCGSSHCSFALEPQKQLELRTVIKIPDLLNDNTNFELSAELKVKVDGTEMIFKEEAPAHFGVLSNI